MMVNVRNAQDTQFQSKKIKMARVPIVEWLTVKKIRYSFQMANAGLVHFTLDHSEWVTIADLITVILVRLFKKMELVSDRDVQVVKSSQIKMIIMIFAALVMSFPDQMLCKLCALLTDVLTIRRSLIKDIAKTALLTTRQAKIREHVSKSIAMSLILLLRNKKMLVRKFHQVKILKVTSS